jgi:hypothetical protein
MAHSGEAVVVHWGGYAPCSDMGGRLVDAWTSAWVSDSPKVQRIVVAPLTMEYGVSNVAKHIWKTIFGQGLIYEDTSKSISTHTPDEAPGRRFFIRTA